MDYDEENGSEGESVFVFNNLLEAKLFVDDRKNEKNGFNGFSSSIEEIVVLNSCENNGSLSYNFSSFVFNDSISEKVFVVHDPFLEFLHYGDMFRLNNGVITSGFELFFPGYRGYDNYDYVPKDVIEAFNNNLVVVNDINTFSLESFRKGVFVFEYENSNWFSFLAYLHKLVLGENVSEKSHYTSRTSIFDNEDVSFKNSFFAMLEYRGVYSDNPSEEYDFIGFNRGFERIVFVPSHYRILKLEK